MCGTKALSVGRIGVDGVMVINDIEVSVVERCSTTDEGVVNIVQIAAWRKPGESALGRQPDISVGIGAERSYAVVMEFAVCLGEVSRVWLAVLHFDLTQTVAVAIKHQLARGGKALHNRSDGFKPLAIINETALALVVT